MLIFVIRENKIFISVILYFQGLYPVLGRTFPAPPPRQCKGPGNEGVIFPFVNRAIDPPVRPSVYIYCRGEEWR